MHAQAVRAPAAGATYYDDAQHPRSGFSRWAGIPLVVSGALFSLTMIAAPSRMVAPNIFVGGIGFAMLSLGITALVTPSQLVGLSSLRVDSRGISYQTHAGTLEHLLPAGAMRSVKPAPGVLQNHIVQVELPGHTARFSPGSLPDFQAAVQSLIDDSGNASSLSFSDWAASAFYTETRDGPPRTRAARLFTAMTVACVVAFWIATLMAANRLIEPGPGARLWIIAAVVLLNSATTSAFWAVGQVRALDFGRLAVLDDAVLLTDRGDTHLVTIRLAQVKRAIPRRLLTRQEVVELECAESRPVRIYSDDAAILAAAIEAARRYSSEDAPPKPGRKF